MRRSETSRSRARSRRRSPRRSGRSRASALSDASRDRRAWLEMPRTGLHGARSYWTGRPDGDGGGVSAVTFRASALLSDAVQRDAAAHSGLADAAEARGRRTVVAPEGLRELGRLAVPDAVRHVPDGQAAFAQELERALHPHLGHVGAEARRARLGERPLELAARGREAPRHVVQLDLVRVFALDDLRGLVEERAPARHRPGADGHGRDTRNWPFEMSARGREDFVRVCCKAHEQEDRWKYGRG